MRRKYVLLALFSGFAAGAIAGFSIWAFYEMMMKLIITVFSLGGRI